MPPTQRILVIVGAIVALVIYSKLPSKTEPIRVALVDACRAVGTGDPGILGCRKAFEAKVALERSVDLYGKHLSEREYEAVRIALEDFDRWEWLYDKGAKDNYYMLYNSAWSGLVASLNKARKALE